MYFISTHNNWKHPLSLKKMQVVLRMRTLKDTKIWKTSKNVYLSITYLLPKTLYQSEVTELKYFVLPLEGTLDIITSMSDTVNKSCDTVCGSGGNFSILVCGGNAPVRPSFGRRTVAFSRWLRNNIRGRPVRVDKVKTYINVFKTVVGARTDTLEKFAGLSRSKFPLKKTDTVCFRYRSYKHYGCQRYMLSY